MFKIFVTLTLLLGASSFGGGILKESNEQLSSYKNDQITEKKNANSSFVPPDPFTSDYGVYCLSDTNSISKYLYEVNIHYSRNDEAYILEAPYLTYVPEEERYFRVTFEHTVTHAKMYGATYDLWSPKYNPQPYITRTDCFNIEAYLGNTHTTRLGYTLDGISKDTDSYYFQNLKLKTFRYDDKDYNNFRLTYRQCCYCSGIEKVTYQQSYRGELYNVTNIGNPIITTTASYYMQASGHYPDTYGDYFLSTINCSGLGDNLDKELVTSKWEEVKDYYEALPNTNKEAVRLGSNPHDVDNLEALRRYDYCLFYKNYPLEDFLNRGGLTNKYYQTPSSLSLFKKEDDISLFIIILVSSFALLSITCLSIVLVKKRSNPKE